MIIPYIAKNIRTNKTVRKLSQTVYKDYLDDIDKKEPTYGNERVSSQTHTFTQVPYSYCMSCNHRRCYNADAPRNKKSLKKQKLNRDEKKEIAQRIRDRD